ncbi:glycerate kinase [Natrialbaceae archaeon A-CW2]
MFRNRRAHETTPARETALACLEAGIEAAVPERVVPETVSLEGVETNDSGDSEGPPRLCVSDTTYDLTDIERVLVLGGGKASGAVTTALEPILEPALETGVLDGIEGLVVANAPESTGYVRVVVGDHPTPSERNLEATAELLELAEKATDRDLVLAPITGGGSALLTAPAAGLSLETLATTTDELLASGASIDEVNAVRSRCSSIKGGGLARAATPAEVVTLAISDVVGDDPSVIASGPTVTPPGTLESALAICRRDGLDVPSAVIDHLEATPDTATDMPVGWHCLATTRTAIDAAERVATDRDYRTLVLSSRLEGEAAHVGRMHGTVAASMALDGNPLEPPAVILSGGEVTVTLGETDGVGGPNQELALAGALEMADIDGMGSRAALASVDTDGIDGPTEACGAIVDGTLLESETVKIAERALESHDVTPFLDQRGSLLETGPTGTNVNDLRVLVVEER